jgi:hypothetical protein
MISETECATDTIDASGEERPSLRLRCLLMPEKRRQIPAW